MHARPTTIIYEHPASDAMRICLRLEHLYQQIQQNLTLATEAGSRFTMQSLLQTINVIDRPDLKSKITQVINQLSTMLNTWEQNPQVDREKLQITITQLEEFSSYFEHDRERIGERLRTNEFLSQLRLQLNSPAGTCNYKSPAYALWLASSPEQRMQDLKIWMNEFDKLFNGALLLLKLIRTATSWQERTATNGSFQQILEPTINYQLIRIRTDLSYNVYPEFSVGKHRLIIRFLIPNYLEEGLRAMQARENIVFQLSCCRSEISYNNLR